MSERDSENGEKNSNEENQPDVERLLRLGDWKRKPEKENMVTRGAKESWRKKVNKNGRKKRKRKR
jgi:hypothetical protein